MMQFPSTLQADQTGTRCTLTEPTGEPLADGALHTRYRQTGQDWLVVRLDRPGRMIERCLLGSLRQVMFAVAGGPAVLLELDRLAFDPHLGRVCVLRGDESGMDS